MIPLFNAALVNEDRLKMTSGFVLVCVDERVCGYLFACILLSINSGCWQSQRGRWHWDVSVPDLLGTKKGMFVCLCVIVCKRESWCVCVCVEWRGASQAGMSALEKSITIWARFVQRTEGGEESSKTRAHVPLASFISRKDNRGQNCTAAPRPLLSLVFFVLSEHLTPCLNPAGVKTSAIFSTAPHLLPGHFQISGCSGCIKRQGYNWGAKGSSIEGCFQEKALATLGPIWAIRAVLCEHSASRLVCKVTQSKQG